METTVEAGDACRRDNEYKVETWLFFPQALLQVKQMYIVMQFVEKVDSENARLANQCDALLMRLLRLLRPCGFQPGRNWDNQKGTQIPEKCRILQSVCVDLNLLAQSQAGDKRSCSARNIVPTEPVRDLFVLGTTFVCSGHRVCDENKKMDNRFPFW